MLVALKKTPNPFGGDADSLLCYLHKEHCVSIYNPENLSRKNVESAFLTLFGRGQTS